MRKLKIKSIKSIGLQNVYDIEMPSKNNFLLSNGVVAHNCIHSIGYSYITYACMFLKHFYPLEWWTAILTNATETEISGQFWPYVKDMLLPPDINLSTDVMVVDYRSKKIRSKLGIIRGIGEATITPIVEGRPYKDIHEFIEKDVAGYSVTRRLIHVGVLDSLFPVEFTFLDRIQAYEDALELKKFEVKKEEARIDGKKLRATGPKKGQIPEEYLNLSPIQDAALKKAVLPSFPIDLHSLARKHSKVILPHAEVPRVQSANGYGSILLTGAELKALDEQPGEDIQKDKYVAVTAFITDAKEFTYAKGLKKALKLIIDADGHVSERVIWPDYNSGELNYPEALKKGVIATLFLKKRVGRQELSLMNVVIETN